MASHILFADLILESTNIYILSQVRQKGNIFLYYLIRLDYIWNIEYYY